MPVLGVCFQGSVFWGPSPTKKQQHGNNNTMVVFLWFPLTRPKKGTLKGLHGQCQTLHAKQDSMAELLGEWPMLFWWLVFSRGYPFHLGLNQGHRNDKWCFGFPILNTNPQHSKLRLSQITFFLKPFSLAETKGAACFCSVCAGKVTDCQACHNHMPCAYFA